MDLFPDLPPARSRPSEREAPLAERLRPQDLSQFVGQEHLLGEERPLGPVVCGSGRLQSLILWGPPGCGKTTLARLLARRAGLRFVSLSAVLSGVRDLRERIEQAKRSAQPTALFIDEIHRFNKAQQDALLPNVERGTLVLIGATTENPSFEVIPALRSRCRVFTLQPLSAQHLGEIIERALSDETRGLGSLALTLEADARDWLVRLSEGDARRALSLLERAAEGAQQTIGRAQIEAALESRPPGYDKGGEAHYDVISAFIKSLRGSHPDAAVYWMARMLEGGEDPRFICRRMLIFASEDIGNADPQALVLADAATRAIERVGLPEGRIILSQAACYLACAPKSNASLLAIDRAQQAVRSYGALAVPLHLRNAPTELMRREGYAKGYQYPHDHPGHFVRQAYLPDALGEERFYGPGRQGPEAEQQNRLEKLWGPQERETQAPPEASPTAGPANTDDAKDA